MIRDLIFSLENLSLKGTTILSQSSTLVDRNASYANDNDTQIQKSVCASTAPGHKKAWFQVDLGKQYSIRNVIIYYRNEGTMHTHLLPNICIENI
jgi:hypothetical protein